MKKKISLVVFVILVASFSFYQGVRYEKYRTLLRQIPTVESLRKDIVGAKNGRIVVSGEEPKFYYLNSSEEIEELFKLIEFDKESLPKLSFLRLPEYLLFSHCMCSGELKIILNQVHTYISVHHLESIRWQGGYWGGDAPLSEKSKEDLRKWFNNKGIDCFEPVAGGDATR